MRWDRYIEIRWDRYIEIRWDRYIEIIIEERQDSSIEIEYFRCNTNEIGSNR